MKKEMAAGGARIKEEELRADHLTLLPSFISSSSSSSSPSSSSSLFSPSRIRNAKIKLVVSLTLLFLFFLLFSSLQELPSILQYSPQPRLHQDEHHQDYVTCRVGRHEVIFLEELSDFSTFAPSAAPSSAPSLIPSFRPSCNNNESLEIISSTGCDEKDDPGESSEENIENDVSYQDDDQNASNYDCDLHEKSARFKILPIRASLFPSAKHIFILSNSTKSNVDIGNQTEKTICFLNSTMMLPTIASDISFRLHGMHRTQRPELFSIISEEMDRFCEESVSRSWNDSSFESSWPRAVVENIELILLSRNSDDHNDRFDPSISELRKDIILTEEDKRDLLLKHPDEGYRLELHPSTVIIKAYTMAGLRHGLGSAAQLLASPHLLPLPLEVLDWPDNPWRGLLVDTARHFISLSSLKRTINAMQAVKLNILHLHLSDAQAFPIRLENDGDIPLSLLQNDHAHYFRDNEDNSSYSYSSRELKQLVAYAKSRGVTVLPEIDMPAHTLSWGKRIPGLVVNCSRTMNFDQGKKRPSPQIDIAILNPSNPLTMPIVRALLKQISEIFPSLYIHIGGDEVNLECWREDFELVKWAEDRNKTLLELFKDFEAEVFSLVYKLGKVPISWQGLLDMKALPEPQEMGLQGMQPSVLAPWKCWGGLAGHAATVAKANDHPVVTSACWYLDFDSEWNDYLRVNPVEAEKLAPVPSPPPTSPPHEANSSHEPSLPSGVSSNPPNSKPHLVWGGEASMWTEHVDETNLDCRIWPRGGAVASSLWGFDSPTHEVLSSRPTGTIEDIDVKYSSASGNALISSYVRLRYLLSGRGIAASQLTFHEMDSNTMLTSYHRSYKPISFATEQEVYRYLKTQNTLPISGYKRFDLGNVHLTSQCPEIDKDVFRPVAASPQHGDSDKSPHRSSMTRQLKLSQWHVGEEFHGQWKQVMKTWLKQKANLGFDIIGLCELNNWQALESSHKFQSNFPLFRSFSASAGYVYSHIMTCGDDGSCNIGIMSAMPFKVLEEFQQPPFAESGALHVFIDRIKLHVFVAHLNAFDASKRGEETVIIANKLGRLVEKGERVVLMGDLNSLSPEEKASHTDQNISHMICNGSDLFTLKRKFCTNSSDQIDYRPIQTILNSGMIDSCVLICQSIEGLTMESCIERHCNANSRRFYNFSKWSQSSAAPYLPFDLRLDFIFVSPAFNSSLANDDYDNDSMTGSVSVGEVDVNQKKGKASVVTGGGIEVNDLIANLSLQPPIYLEWSQNIH